MAQNVDGTALLGTGASVLTGYIVSEISETETGKEVKIPDEIGDIVTEINNFGEQRDIRISVTAKSGTATPAINDIITYLSKTHGATQKFRVKTIESTEVQEDAVKWVLSGNSHPDITPT